MDFTKETNLALEKIIAKKLPQMIEDKASEMIEDIVKDIFRWGDVKKQIREKIESSINVNLQKFDLIDYSALIGKTINENLLQQVNLQPIVDMTKDIVGFVDKKEISLEEVAQIFIDASMEENDQNGEGEITFITEENDKYNWIQVYADIEPDKNKNDCSFNFIFSTKEDRGQIFSFKSTNGYFDRPGKISPSKLASLNKLEAQIFRLYAAQVKITDYNDSISTHWDRY